MEMQIWTTIRRQEKKKRDGKGWEQMNKHVWLLCWVVRQELVGGRIDELSQYDKQDLCWMYWFWTENDSWIYLILASFTDSKVLEQITDAAKWVKEEKNSFPCMTFLSQIY